MLTIDGMESLLSHQYFKTVNKTEMNSDVFTVLLPTVNNTNLTEPVNFTIQHKKVRHPSIHPSIRLLNPPRILHFQKVPENGIVTCVYWEDHREAGEGGQSSSEMRWSTKGCWISFAHENYTVCSCSHLSTFALIMQIAEVKDVLLKWNQTFDCQSVTPVFLSVLSVLCVRMNTGVPCLHSLPQWIRFWSGSTEFAWLSACSSSVWPSSPSSCAAGTQRSTTQPVFTCASTSPCLTCCSSGTRNTLKMRWGLDSGFAQGRPVRWQRGCVSPCSWPASSWPVFSTS